MNIQQHIQPSDTTVTDLFCGCGGSSEGAEHVEGVKVVLAMNHWQMAIDTHSYNLPNAGHDCADISGTDPRRYRRTNILIGSPECTKNSPASGIRRVNLHQADFFQNKAIDPSVIRSRATMWDMIRFTEVHRYEYIITENVVEVMTAWASWDAWLYSWRNLGYEYELVFLNAQFVHGPELDFYAPQSRDRIYIVCWKKGNPKPDLNITPAAPCPRCKIDVQAVQSWKPNRRAGKYNKQYVYTCPACAAQVLPYYFCALNAIDLSRPMVRIGERAANGLKPLSDNTLARVKWGLDKFADTPLVLDQRNQHGTIGSRVRAATEVALNAQSTGFSSYLAATPVVVDMSRSKESNHDSRVRDAGQEALPAQHTQGNMAVAVPVLMDIGHTHAAHNGKVKNALGSLFTATTMQSSALIMPEVFVQANRDQSPMRLAAAGEFHTQTTATQEYAVALPEAFVQANRRNSAMHRADVGALHTGTTSNSNDYLVLPPGGATVVHHGTSTAQSLTDALNCQTVKQKSSVMFTKELYDWVINRQAFTQPYHGQPQMAPASDALYTQATKAGTTYVEGRQAVSVEDCFWRMLHPEETKRGQGFRADYKVMGNLEQQQKQIGNANPPNTMQLLVGRCQAALQKGGIAL